jgi:hypothetical protein
MDLQYRPATPVDAIRFAPHIRGADMIEMKHLSGGADPADLLVFSVEHSYEKYLVTTPAGEYVAIGGIGHMRGDLIGVPWLISTSLVHKYRKNVLRLCRKAIGMWERNHSTLRNAMNPGNTSARLLIKHLGFLELPPTHNEHGALTLPFIRPSPCAI